MVSKKCGNCGQVKPIPSGWYKNRAQADGLSSMCRVCTSAHNLASRDRRHDSVIAYNREYRKAHPEKVEEWKRRKQLRLSQRYQSESRSAGVYFVGSPTLDVVKIGTTTNLPVRLKMLRCGSPVPIDVLAWEPHDNKGLAHIAEGGYRERFAASRRHGEWYALTPELREIIDAIIQNQTDIAS